MRCLAALLCCIVILTSASCISIGQRMMTVQIEQGGKVVFESHKGVPDTTPVPEMWEQIESLKFDAVDANQSTGTLAGKVVIRIKHVDKELSKVVLPMVSLRSPSTNQTDWMIDPEEANKIRTAVKIAANPKPPQL